MAEILVSLEVAIYAQPTRKSRAPERERDRGGAGERRDRIKKRNWREATLRWSGWPAVGLWGEEGVGGGEGP